MLGTYTPLLCLTLLVPSALFASPAARISCVAQHNPINQYDRQTKTMKEVDDWFIDCTIKIGSEQIYAAALPIAHPASYHDAMDAIAEFRKKAPQIIADWDKGKK